MNIFENINTAFSQANIDVVIDSEQQKDMTRTFKELGLDSLDLFNFFLELDALTGKQIPESEFDKIKNISDVIEIYK
ncbi:hypothetical protein TUM4438_35730 [Shewanella sairae]|uniref:Carrier domain-containing protein n=1 Tax=Shewanella sairae TaxID=190310 RepID=A0ABQ4PP31_9GAMM|nr:phosphopantetheine-binding protein [Shewanella sairae]MCL1129263.1 phosphopantetheine-binding protein [Shewanella sairae]GIU50285.1 hypothetical protein TUM4438_35730 [Shewanella sairae]